MGDSEEESYRTYGDYRRAKDGAGGIKRERRAPPRDMNPEEPAGKRFRGNMYDGPPSSTSGAAGSRKDEDDDGFQPSMMSFKAFLETQDDSITDEEALSKYGEYKLEFRRQQLNEFFVGHKEEEWFRLKYHPLEVEKRRKMVAANLQRRLDVFSQLVLKEEKEGVVGLTSDHEGELVGLLDRVVVCLEGGEPEDLEHLAKGTPDTEWRCLHKTASIHLRKVPSGVTRQELEDLARKFPGYIRLALSEPAPEKRWQRRAWLSFRRDAKVKEICYSLANIKLRDTDLSPVLNKDLSQRIRAVPLLTNDRRVMQQDVRLAAALIGRLDAKWGLWELRQTSELLGAESTNPVVQNITDYLVEEASAEEDELLGFHSSSREDTQTVPLTSDSELAGVLDRMVLYLRVVHSVDFYNLAEYSSEDEMPNRCGILHVRERLPAGESVPQVSLAELEKYNEEFEKRARGSLLSTLPESLTEQETAKLGLKVEKDELEKFIQANTQELGQEKWLCPLSNKKFKAADFVRKHIFNKHAEKVEAVKADVEFFNNFLRDPRRPQLPEKPKPKAAPQPPPPRRADAAEEERRPRGAEGPRGAPSPAGAAQRKGSIKERLGYRPETVRITHSAKDPRGMVDYSDVEFSAHDFF